jgi:hypothetical protein
MAAGGVTVGAAVADRVAIVDLAAVAAEAVIVAVTAGRVRDSSL